MRALVLALALLAAVPALAQEAQPPAPILVLRQDALFEGSAFGRASRARIEAASRALIAENRTIEAGLEAEERDLTALRATLPPADFRARADSFNAKVEDIRKAQDAKSRAIARQRDEDRQRFLQAAVPVLAQIMQEHGAALLLDQASVVLNLESLDITDAAIARIDAAIGEGAAPGGSAGPPDPPSDPPPGSPPAGGTVAPRPGQP
jgi:Skp family chaperone for outer membrane proteins